MYSRRVSTPSGCGQTSITPSQISARWEVIVTHGDVEIQARHQREAMRLYLMSGMKVRAGLKNSVDIARDFFVDVGGDKRLERIGYEAIVAFINISERCEPLSKESHMCEIYVWPWL